MRSDGGGRHPTKEGQTADEKQAARTKSQKTNKIQISNPKSDPALTDEKEEKVNSETRRMRLMISSYPPDS